MFIEVNKLVDCKPSKKFIQSVLGTAIKIIKNKIAPDTLSVAIVNEKIIKNLNKQYRKINKPTDVLSFDDPEEIIIYWDLVVKQAKEHNISQEKELSILLIHGLLHILGYEHKTKKQQEEMNKITQKILNKKI